MMIHTLLGLSLLLPLGDSNDDVARPDWPQWRGPLRDGHCPTPAWPESLDEERIQRDWRIELGRSYASPIVAADRVFTVETRDESHEVVRAIDRKTGEQIWSTEWTGAMSVPFFAARNGSWVRSTPAFDGDSLYVAGMRDVLVCLSGEDGEVRWKVDFTERYGTPLPSFGFVCSPLVVGEHLYIQAGSSLVKLDKLTGKTVWRALEDSGGMDSAFSSPTMATLGGVDQLLVQTRKELCGVAPEDGEILWRIEIPAFRGMNILTPTVHGEGVFTAAYGGRSQMLVPQLTEGGAWSVERTWEARPRGYMTSPSIIDGHAYLFLQSNRFSCVRLEDGEVGWISEPMGDEYWSLVHQEDRILALTHDGELVLIQADPTEYKELGRVRVSEAETWASLGISGDQLFVRELEALSSFTWR